MLREIIFANLSRIALRRVTRLRSRLLRIWRYFLIGTFVKPGKHVICALILLGALVVESGLVAAAPVVASPAYVEPDLLEPERAFQLSARRKDHKTVELQYKIAEGYYMYKGRFKFEVEQPASVKLGKAALAKGLVKQDATFGRVETYRDSVRILLPVAGIGNATALDAVPLRLKVTSQGCADAGVCYPPLRQTLTLASSGFDVVLPDGIADVGGLAGSSRSSSSSAQPSLSDALKKSK